MIGLHTTYAQSGYIRGISAGLSQGEVIYTRWGKHTCPTHASLLYSGTMAGSAWENRGGGSNFLCMPNNPQYYQTRYRVQGHTYLHGAEYAQPLRSSSAELNAPCAVCTVSRRNLVVMIPARIYCPSGWTREYYGYIMAEHRERPRNTFTCIDIAQEGVYGSRGHGSAGDLWHVEAHCSGLKCPPYNPSKEITCVVCTR